MALVGSNEVLVANLLEGKALLNLFDLLHEVTKLVASFSLRKSESCFFNLRLNKLTEDNVFHVALVVVLSEYAEDFRVLETQNA